MVFVQHTLAWLSVNCSTKLSVGSFGRDEIPLVPLDSIVVPGLTALTDVHDSSLC